MPEEKEIYETPETDAYDLKKRAEYLTEVYKAIQDELKDVSATRLVFLCAVKSWWQNVNFNGPPF